jgi:hypothetical protein
MIERVTGAIGCKLGRSAAQVCMGGSGSLTRIVYERAFGDLPIRSRNIFHLDANLFPALDVKSDLVAVRHLV